MHTPQLNEGEPFWRAYNQLREIAFIMNDGLAATEILKTNPDLKRLGFKPNDKYPLPEVFDNFDPTLIDADNRINMAMLFPVGRTHISKLLRAGASANLKRLKAGKKGLNVIIARYAPVVDIGDRKGVVLKSGHFYMNKDEFKKALRICKGYTEEAADRVIADLEKQGSMIDGRIRVVARFTKPIIATSVAPYHHIPIFDNGELEDAGIPATCQSLVTWDITYDKALYEEMLEGTGVRMPKEIRWQADWTEALSSENERIEALIEGRGLKGEKDKVIKFKGLRTFAKELIDAEEEPIIVAKGAEESGARNMKVFLLKKQKGKSLDNVLKEAAKFILDVSRMPQNVVIQRVIRINPEYWGSETLMNEFTKRRITERSSPVLRTKIPPTPYYASFRVVPSSSSPDKPYDMTSHIVVINTEIATNVGRGGSLEPLLAEWIQENYRDVIKEVLEENSTELMKAINDFAPKFAERFKKKHGRDIGEDALGTSYGWMPFGLLDFLVEPVFEREGRIVDIKPKYDGGERIGSDIILEDENGKRFVGKIKKGRAGWRCYMIEPNTGIGQIDRRNLRMEELEVKRAAKEDRAVDWQKIERDDHIILSNWADRGQEYGQTVFGDNFFKPSPKLTPDDSKATVTLVDYLKQTGQTEEAAKAKRRTGNTQLDNALDAARQALELKPEDKFDEIAFSVLLKYYVVEKLKQRYDVDDVRKAFIQGEFKGTEYKDFVTRINNYLNTPKTAEAMFKLCGNQLDITEDRLSEILEDPNYTVSMRRLIKAHFMTEWSGKEVEISPDLMTPSQLFSLMPDKRHIIAHLSLDNPVAPNETYALMADVDASSVQDMAVVGVDLNDLFQDNTAANKVLALVQFPGQDKKRLVEVLLTKPLFLSAIWRDETCPAIKTSLPQVNPKKVSEFAYDKLKTLELLYNAGVDVPPYQLCPRYSKYSSPKNFKARLIKDLKEMIVVYRDRDKLDVFVSPNEGTQGIMTKKFTVREGHISEDADDIISHIKSIEDKTGGVSLIREAMGNVRYAGEDDNTYTLDFRYNVAYVGGDEYLVLSEYATVAQDPQAPTSSVRKGGRFISTLEAYKMLVVTLPDGTKKRVSLSNDDIMEIRQKVRMALKALNEGRPEDKKLLFVGVDVKLNIEIHKKPILDTYRVGTKEMTVTPIVIEINSQAAGLSHAYKTCSIDDKEAEPAVAEDLWKYLGERIKSSSGGEIPDLRGIAEINSGLAKGMNFDDRVKQLTNALMGREESSVAGGAFMDWIFHESLWDKETHTEKDPSEIRLDTNPLIATVTERSPDLSQIKRLGLGTFYLARKLARNPHMVDVVFRDLNSISGQIREEYGPGHNLEYLIWTGGSAVDKYLCEASGLYQNGPVKVFVLDNTDPASLKGIIDEMVRLERQKARKKQAGEMPYEAALQRALKKSLVMLQESGLTHNEPVISARLGLQPLFDHFKIDGKLHFRGITTDDSPLDSFMKDKGYIRLPHQADGKATLSERDDAPLSYGYLIPLMLNNIDIEKWIAQTQLSDEEIETVMNLAAWIIANLERGTNKITLFLPDEWESFGPWIKKLFEGYLGKRDDFGLKIVIGQESDRELYPPTKANTEGRCYLNINVKGLSNDHEADMQRFREDAHFYSVKSIELDDIDALAEGVLPAKLMQMLHLAVFPVAYSFGLSAVDEPLVEKYRSMVELFQIKGLEDIGQWNSFSSGVHTKYKNGITLKIYPIINLNQKKRRAIGAAEFSEQLAELENLVPGIDINDPVSVYAALHLIAMKNKDKYGEPAVQYGSLIYYGDSKNTADGAAIKRLIEKRAASFYRSMGLPADADSGPDYNHASFSMDKGYKHGFVTAIMSKPESRVKIDKAPDYRGGYITMQWFATMMSLCGYQASADGQALEWADEEPGYVVGITIDKTDEETRVALEDFFKRAEKLYSQVLVARNMHETIEMLKGHTPLVVNRESDWETTDLENQKYFFRLLLHYLHGKHKNDQILIIRTYFRWLFEHVFSRMQEIKTDEPFRNRLYPNQFMEFMSSELEKNIPAKELFEEMVNSELPNFLVTIINENADVYHRFLTNLATDKRIVKQAAFHLIQYAEHHRKLDSSADIVKAEPAYAIAADILKHYLNKEKQAKEYEAEIREVDRELYNKYKQQLLSGKPILAPHFVKGGKNKVFFGFSPSKLSWSSMVGSDARYNVLLDPDGGMAVNAPVVFFEHTGQQPSMPVTIVQRTREKKILLRTISMMDPKNPTKEEYIRANDIEKLYTIIDKETREDDPFSFMKYALFFTGIIGSGIDKDEVRQKYNITDEERDIAKKDPMELAKLYHKRCPEQALEDISEFMRGGGIEITCDNHMAPMAAGFSSSSTAAISILLTLYAISRQDDFVLVENLKEMALIFENDLGRGTGAQDTDAMLSGVKEIHYSLTQDGAIEGKPKQLDIADTILRDMSRRTLVFVPGISSRAASETIGKRQLAYLLREPKKFEALQIAKRQHNEIVEALKNGQFDRQAKLMWEYTLNRNKIHTVLPAEMKALFKRLMGGRRTKKALIHGGMLAGAMGKGAGAILIATDYGMEEIEDPAETGRTITRLEAELRKIIATDKTFKNAYVRHLEISDTGPYGGVGSFAKDYTESLSQIEQQRIKEISAKRDTNTKSFPAREDFGVSAQEPLDRIGEALRVMGISEESA